MKEQYLLENFILNSKATNKEHQEAIVWLHKIVNKCNQLEQQVSNKAETE